MDRRTSGTTRDDELLESLRSVCGQRHVIADRARLHAYSPQQGPPPRLVVLPRSAAEVQSVVRICREAGSRITIRGAGTSATGITSLGFGSVLLVLARMRRVLRLDRGRREVTAEAGVPLGVIARMLDTRTSTPVATVGGALAVGGAIADHVIAVELVTAAASRLTLDRGESGYDLLGAFGGSAGTLGIAVSVRLRIPRGDVPLDAAPAGAVPRDNALLQRLAIAFDPDQLLTASHVASVAG
jgi:glycolate oxidase